MPDVPLARRAALTRRFHPESAYGGFTDRDGTIAFYVRVRALLGENDVALDVGCGRGTHEDDDVPLRRELRTLRHRCRKVIGIDVDPVGAENPTIDEFRLIPQGGPWPVEDASVDLAIADFVVEHVPDPEAFFAELERVVRPGGHVCLRTVNRRSYLGLVSRLVPNVLHARVLGRAHPERRPGDVFPTLYRCNTVKDMSSAFERHGFECAVYGTEAEPVYLGFSAPTYALGLAHARLAPRSLRVGLLGWGRRNGGPDAGIEA